jgi:hypothetical protein
LSEIEAGESRVLLVIDCFHDGFGGVVSGVCYYYAAEEKLQIRDKVSKWKERGEADNIVVPSVSMALLWRFPRVVAAIVKTGKSNQQRTLL